MACVIQMVTCFRTCSLCPIVYSTLHLLYYIYKDSNLDWQVAKILSFDIHYIWKLHNMMMYMKVDVMFRHRKLIRTLAKNQSYFDHYSFSIRKPTLVLGSLDFFYKIFVKKFHCIAAVTSRLQVQKDFTSCSVVCEW